VAFVANSFAVINYAVKRRHVSAIPLVGGIAGALALVVLPFPKANGYWWVPLIIDYGTAPMMAFFFISRIRDSVRSHR